VPFDLQKRFLAATRRLAERFTHHESISKVEPTKAVLGACECPSHDLPLHRGAYSFLSPSVNKSFIFFRVAQPSKMGIALV
jgi:hypothetical protein